MAAMVVPDHLVDLETEPQRPPVEMAGVKTEAVLGNNLPPPQDPQIEDPKAQHSKPDRLITAGIKTITAEITVNSQTKVTVDFKTVHQTVDLQQITVGLRTIAITVDLKIKQITDVLLLKLITVGLNLQNLSKNQHKIRINRMEDVLVVHWRNVLMFVLHFPPVFLVLVSLDVLSVAPLRNKL